MIRIVFMSLLHMIEAARRLIIAKVTLVFLKAEPLEITAARWQIISAEVFFLRCWSPHQLEFKHGVRRRSMYPPARRVCLQCMVAFPGRWRYLSSTNALMSVKEDENSSAGRSSSASFLWWMPPILSSLRKCLSSIVLHTCADLCWCLSYIVLHSCTDLCWGFSFIVLHIWYLLWVHLGFSLHF